jgi:hypothetical protein
MRKVIVLMALALAVAGTIAVSGFVGFRVAIAFPCPSNNSTGADIALPKP